MTEGGKTEGWKDWDEWDEGEDEIKRWSLSLSKGRRG